MDHDPKSYPDLTNTVIAFQNKSNKELKTTERLFSLMNHRYLVSFGSKLAKLGLTFRLPFIETIIKKTIFHQFCGGIHLTDCQDVIDNLYRQNVLSLLDYGVEAKSKKEELDAALEELLRAIDFAAANVSVPAAICKLTALVDNDILIKKQDGTRFNTEETAKYNRFVERVSQAAKRAFEQNTSLLIDAEESWMQDVMDELALDLMRLYNKDRVTIYNTYQMYRKSCLEHLKEDHHKAQKEDFLLGAKLVRGAYMNKERERAISMGYPSPINDTKEATDEQFDQAVIYCLDHYQQIGFICATHNISSTNLMAREIIDRQLPRDHPHINFSQLQGMSDYITFNLAKYGFNVAKYVVYGPIGEVAEFLIRRAEENASVTGEASRELSLIRQEIKRRRQ